MFVPVLTQRSAAKTPAQVSGLYAWWDASVGASLIQDRLNVDPTLADDDGEPVGTWRDQSGNARHLQAAGDANRPTLKKAAQNGRDGLRFDAVDDMLRADVIATGLMGGTDKAFTVAWVGKQSSVSGNRSFWGTNNSANALSHHRFRCNGSTSYHSDRRDDAGSSVSVSGSTPDTSTHAFVLAFTGTTVSLYRDGVAVFSGSAQNVGANTMTSFSVGAWFRNAAGETTEEFLAGDVYEMAVFDSAISAADAAALYAGWQPKWGV